MPACTIGAGTLCASCDTGNNVGNCLTCNSGYALPSTGAQTACVAIPACTTETTGAPCASCGTGTNIGYCATCNTGYYMTASTDTVCVTCTGATACTATGGTTACATCSSSCGAICGSCNAGF